MATLNNLQVEFNIHLAHKRVRTLRLDGEESLVSDPRAMISPVDAVEQKLRITMKSGQFESRRRRGKGFAT